MWLYITLGIVLLVAILLCFDVYVKITYVDGLTVNIGYMGLHFSIFPQKPLTEKQKLKKQKNEKKDKARKETKKKQKTEEEKGESKFTFKKILLILKDIIHTITTPIQHLLKHVRIENVDAVVIVGTDDCAKTAQDYGELCTLIYGIVAGARNFMKLKVKRLYVGFDFVKDYYTYDINCKVKIRLFFLVTSVLWLVFGMINHIVSNRETYFGEVKKTQGNSQQPLQEEQEPPLAS